MSNRYEGEKCPICQSYLFEEDDIVVCPTCGAPQHRDCYQTLGHCGLAELHGTPEQYDLTRVQKADQNPEPTQKTQETQANPTHCPRCRQSVPADAAFCPLCGMPLRGRASVGGANIPFGGFASPFSGVHKQTDVGGISAEQAADFIGPNAIRYLQKFLKLGDRKAGWNWAAFLLPYGWFFARKQYAWGFITALAMLIATICLIPMQAVIMAQAALLPDGSSWMELLNAVASQPEVIGSFEYLMSLLGLGLALLVRVLSGLFADSGYRSYVVHWVKKIEADDELDNGETFRKKGGLNPLLLVLSYFLFDQIANILLMYLI